MDVAKSVLFIILALYYAGNLFAADYYVDAENGSDSNTGTSVGSEWQTVRNVNEALSQAGDVIHFQS